jgi:thioredoxin 1
MIAYVTELNSNNFSDFTSNGLVLVDIWATWCGPCKMVAPIVDQISSDYHGKLSVGKLDADQNRDIVSNLGVRNIPTLLLYKDGEVIDRLVGAVSKEKLSEMIERHLEEQPM